VEGILKKGTPVCVPDKKDLLIGRVEGIERNHEEINQAVVGDEVAVKINQDELGKNVCYGRHFDHNNQICSLLTRKSIDLLKSGFKDEMNDELWKLVIKLKRVFKIT